ncbi:MAG: hypothetical protein ACPGTG_03090 [Flavobacteriales bacterium]
MKLKLLYLILVLGVALPLQAQEPIHARKLAHDSFSSKAKLDSTIQILKDKSDDLSIAYTGLCETMMANHVFWPGAKLAFFNAGKKKIEQACAHKGKHTFELSYIRLLVQLNAPSFLAYDEAIESDLNYVEQEFKTTKLSSKWKSIFISNILGSKHLSKQHKERLTKLKDLQL